MSFSLISNNVNIMISTNGLSLSFFIVKLNKGLTSE